MPDNKFGGFGGIAFGSKKPTPQPTPPNPNPNPNSENLKSALRASLTLIENEDKNSNSNDDIPSPLNEATPDSVDILLDRINTHMIEGKILSDSDLKLAIDVYRSQALKYAQEESTKKPRTRTTKPTLKQVLDLDLEF